MRFVHCSCQYITQLIRSNLRIITLWLGPSEDPPGLAATSDSGGSGSGNHYFKLVYSGDTRPCHELIDAGRGATILIHEATMENALWEEALLTRHATTEEAVPSPSNEYRTRVCFSEIAI